MTNIVCDTMIWYNLSKGKLKIPDRNQYTLVCTYLTLMELAFSPNNLRKLSEVQDAINQILDSKASFILTYPFDYARTLVDEDYNPVFNIEEDLVFAFLRILLKHSKEGLLDNEFKAQLADIASKRLKGTNEWSDFLNELNEPTKEASWLFKKFNSSKWSKDKFQGWFVLQLNQSSDKLYSTDLIDWECFEFYERMYIRYHRNLMVSKMKADSNDDNDLRNMIYVQPTDLYWTLEKRWLVIAREAGVEKYLYKEI